MESSEFSKEMVRKKYDPQDYNVDNYNYDELATNLELLKKSIKPIQEKRLKAISAWQFQTAEEYEWNGPPGSQKKQDLGMEASKWDEILIDHIVLTFKTEKCNESVLRYAINLLSEELSFEKGVDPDSPRFVFKQTLELKNLSDSILSCLATDTFTSGVEGINELFFDPRSGLETKTKMLKRITSYMNYVELPNIDQYVEDVFSYIKTADDLMSLLDIKDLHYRIVYKIINKALQHKACNESVLNKILEDYSNYLTSTQLKDIKGRLKGQSHDSGVKHI